MPPRIFDYLDDRQNNVKIHGARLNAEFETIYRHITTDYMDLLGVTTTYDYGSVTNDIAYTVDFGDAT